VRKVAVVGHGWAGTVPLHRANILPWYARGPGGVRRDKVPTWGHIRSKESYGALKQWIADARDYGRADIALVLCANKIDLNKDRAVTSEQGTAIATEERVEYIETSAFTGENVEETFTKIAEMLLQ
jgi:hypothetical protein